MFVAPRPLAADDPLFAVRLALATTLAYALGLWLRPTMPMIAPALTAGIVAGMRGRFDPLKAVGGPITMAVVMSAMALLVAILRDFPAVMIIVIGAIYTASYTLILRTGNPLEVDSRAIRAKIAAGEPVKLVPAPVLRYIQEHNLYR